MKRPAKQRLVRRLVGGWLLAGAMLVAAASPCFAVRPDEMLSDPALEARAEAISRDIRCVVCQRQSIEDSAAAVAHDLRVLIREQLKTAASDADVKGILVACYRAFVLLQSPFQG